MVTAISNQTESYVEWEMPMARGLQYQAIWLEKEGHITKPVNDEEEDNSTCAAWQRIAGRK